MTSAFSSAGDRSSRFPGGDIPLQNLKSLYAESPDLLIFTRAVSPRPPTAAASKTSAARTFAPITIPMEKRGRKSVEIPDRAAVAQWLDQLAASTCDRRYRHAASIVRAPPAGRPPCADDPLVTETHQTAQRDGWAFPSHY